MSFRVRFAGRPSASDSTFGRAPLRRPGCFFLDPCQTVTPVSNSHSHSHTSAPQPPPPAGGGKFHGNEGLLHAHGG
eukprot:6675761-Pyramimonas_sp.AAC.1